MAQGGVVYYGIITDTSHGVVAHEEGSIADHHLPAMVPPVKTDIGVGVPVLHEDHHQRRAQGNDIL